MAAVTGAQLLASIMGAEGKPYVWGGQSLNGADCSGLMWLAGQLNGISIPRTSNAQIAALQSIDMNNAQVGDLIFFDSENNGQSDHVGMYAGNGMVFVADNPSQPIHMVPVSSEARVTGVGRMPGVVNSGTPDSGLAHASTAGLESALGLNHSASVPAARPTFDMWGSLGLQAPNSAQLNENYGLSAAFMNSDPEIANIFSEAVANTWSTQQFQSALQQTAWWQTHGETARQLLVEKASNPAQYQQQLNDKLAIIKEQAVKLGVHMSDQGLQNLSSTSLLLNYNDAQINGMLSKYLEMSQDGHFGGYAGQVELGLREYSRDMGIPLTDEYVKNAVTGIVAGTDTLQARRAYIQTQSASAFPAFADQINKGVPMGVIAAPYLQTQAKIWEVDPNKIDLYDPTLRAALQHENVDPKNQNREAAVLPVYDFENTLRKDPKWLKTNNAREGMLAGANQVLSDLGLNSQSVGAAPKTSLSVTENSRASFGGLSGATTMPTLHQNVPAAPTAAGANASSLAEDNSFKVTDF